MVKKVFNFFIRIALSLFLISIITILGFYFWTTIYSFPNSKGFTGNEFYNPYQNCGEKTFKANFHAHSAAWGNVTYGHNTAQQLFDGYTKKGYDIAAISNYHTINDYGKGKSKLFIPVYEHGLNIFKSHVLAINSKKVSYLDFPLFQSTSHQQKIIENLKKNGDLVALAHPNFGGGRSLIDMQQLTHYDFLEVLNHYRISDVEWDNALSSGRLSWLMANDDTHDVRDETAFKIWNIIYANEENVDTILGNMQKGMHYGIKTSAGVCTNYLKSCILRNDSLFVSFTDTIVHFDVHGGAETLEDYQQFKKDFVYKLKPSDDYIRIVAKNDKSMIFLNPIIRYDGQNIPLASNILPKVDYSKTFIVRFIIALFIIEIIRLLIITWKLKTKK